ncbi:PAS domain S-box protein [Natronomonas pharaonis]|nr:PAS domain S-box protein [Natronomonas pharaonis]
MIQQGYIAVFALTGVVCLLAATTVRSFTNPDVRRGLVGLLALNGFWSLATAVQLATTAHPVARAMHILALVLGIATVFAWLAFASAYSGREYHRQRTLQAAGAFVYLAIVAVKVSNPLHGLYFATSVVADPFAHIAISYHAFHWFVTGFAYTAAGVGFLWLFESFNRNSAGGTAEWSARPAALYVLVAATALPIVPYGLSSYSDLLIRTNYEPLGVAVFALGVSLYARAEFRRHSSPSHSALVDGLSDGGLLVDESETVINANERAAEILGRSYVPRVPLAELDTELASLETGETTRITRSVGGDERVFETHRLTAEDSPIAAEMVTLKDVTRVSRLEQLMGIHRDINEALIDAAEPWQFVRELPDQFAAIDAYEFVWLYPVADDSSDGSLDSSSWTAPDDSLDDGFGAVAGDAAAYPRWADAEASSTEPVLTAAARRQATRVGVSKTDAEWARRLSERGVTDCLAVPVAVTDEQPVVLGVYTTDSNGFDAAETQLIEEICRLVPEAVRRITAHRDALRYKEAITHTATAVFITDTDGTIEYVNPAFERLTGYSKREAIGSTPSMLQSGDMDDDYYDQLWDTINAGEVFKERITNKTKHGDRYIAEQTISPILDDDGSPSAFVAIQFEVTNRMLREQRLSVLHRVLRHNLRTNLNVIDGHATLVEDQLDAAADADTTLEAANDSLETIRAHTTKLADQSATAQRIEQALSNDRSGRTCLPVAELATTARETAERLGGTCEVAVRMDRCRQIDAELRQVVEELVENAVVHNDAPPAEATVRLTLEQDGNELVLVIEDDGPGIPDTELVFTEEGTEEPLHHSSGLDVWLVKWLVVSIGGSVTVSTDDDGTSVRVAVPIRSPDAAEPEAAQTGLD